MNGQAKSAENDDAERAAGADPYNPCRCGERDPKGCTPTRVLHWLCSSCGAGPFTFTGRRFLGSRLLKNERGVVVAVRYWCSRSCRVREERTYLLSQLSVARARGDLRLCTILTGQLAQLGQPTVPGPGSTEETASELVTGHSDTPPE